MADNTQLPVPSTNGDVIATDDIGGVKFQRIKMILGADGVNDGDVSSSNPVPVSITGSIPVTIASAIEITNDAGNAIPISASSLPLPTGAATNATLIAIQELQQEIKDFNENLLFILTAMFEKMPRVTGNDQAAVSVEAGAISTVTTVSNLQSMGAKYINGDNLNMSGLQQLYSNIVVS